jgi:transposase
MVYEQYHGLWQIEQSFRITKSTLKIRPIFVFNEKRIEAHICICFVALKVHREIERKLQNSGIKLSVDKVIKIAKTITTIKPTSMSI